MIIIDNIYIKYLNILIFLNKKKFKIRINFHERKKEFNDFIENRKKRDLNEGLKVFRLYKKKITYLFNDNVKLRDFIFDTFSELWKKGEKTKDQEIYALITQISIANAVIAGLPGKLGIGVVICIALEFYMALAISRKEKFHISEENLLQRFMDLSKYGFYFTSVAFIAIYGFRHMFGFVFSLVPAVLPQTVIAEYVVTTFVGILFWEMFKQTRKPSLFRLILSSSRKTKSLLNYQWDALRDTFNPENLKETGTKIRIWFLGDFLEELPKTRMDIFISLNIGFLIEGNYQKLEGPLGQVFIESIRDRWSKELSNASIPEISEFMREEYTHDQIPHVISTIKGKFFEHLSVLHENNDGDPWVAHLHKDESYPGSDMIIINSETGETIELSLKATYSQDYVESALSRYPDIPIIATSEVAEDLNELDMLVASQFSNREIQEITEKNFEELVNNLTPFSKSAGIAATAIGVGMATAVSLWPYAMAYWRGKIQFEQLKKACEKVFPKAGGEMAYRIMFMFVFGPIYGWYVLASTAMRLTPKPKETTKMVVKYLEYKSS